MDTPRDQILDAALRIVPFEGWTDRTLVQAVARAELPEGSGALYFPDGALGLIRHWNRRTVDHVEAEIAARGLGNLGTTQRIREAVLIALAAIGPHTTAMRRAISRLGLPDAAGEAPRQLWAMSDAIWAAIGDTSTDFNFYSKRAVLSGVLASTTLSWLNDPDPDKASARAHLDRRLANVGQFEKAKARLRTLTDRLPNPAEALGRLRYATSSFDPTGPLTAFRSPSTKSRRRRSR